MSAQINFERAYDSVAVKVLAYQRDYPKLTTAQRAEQAVNNDQEMNKAFADKLLAEGLGQHIDLWA